MQCTILPMKVRNNTKLCTIYISCLSKIVGKQRDVFEINVKQASKLKSNTP